MIGIVGGAGPLAGLDIFKKIIEETPAAADQDHAPVLLFSLPSQIPDRTEFLLGKEKTNPAFAFSKILQQLETAGATVAAIPCNTAHAPEILNVVKQELKARDSKIELLHLIEETSNYITEHFPNKKIGVLSTTGTHRTGLYRTALEEQGLSVLEADEEWQDKIHLTVYDREYGVKAKSSPATEKAKEELRLAMDYITEKGAEVLVLGCTELPLVYTDQEFKGIAVVDPNRILARALINRLKKTIL